MDLSSPLFCARLPRVTEPVSDSLPAVAERESLDIPKKLHFKELMADPHFNPKTWEEVVAEIGCDRKTLYEWRKDDKLMGELLRERRKRMVAIAPRVDDALTQAALKGDPQAIKLFYEKFEGLGALAHQAPVINVIINSGGIAQSIPVEVIQQPKEAEVIQNTDGH